LDVFEVTADVVVFECHCACSPAPSVHSLAPISGKSRDGNFMQPRQFCAGPFG
jgi:hypothetical protein